MIATYLTIISDKSPASPNLEELAHHINFEHQKCLNNPHLALIYGCNAGDFLLTARAQICDEEWRQWLTSNCTVSEQTAETYMQIARKFPNVNSQTENQAKQNLPQPSTPQITNLNLAEQVQVYINSDAQNSAMETVDQEEIELPPRHEDQPMIPEVEEKETEPSSLPKSKPSQTPVAASEAIIDVEFIPITTQQQKPSSAQQTIRFFIPGAVVPKARPRVTTNGTYMPPRYREWRNRAEVEIYRQISEHHPKHKFPIRKASISLRFFGNHRTNSDLDNLAGACLDALTLKGAGVLMDDRVSCVPQLNVEFIPNVAETGVWIEIEPIL